MKKILLLLTFITTVSLGHIDAQKIGYLNSQGLLMELPAYKNAQANFENYRNQLQKKLEQKAQLLEADFQLVSRKAEQGELSPKQQEEEGVRLREEQNKLLQYEQQIQQELLTKQNTELQPIVDKVNTAIETVAKENGFTYILDASSGVILYADDTMDVTSLVKAKLGL